MATQVIGAPGVTPSMYDLRPPDGTVTLLFTDIEGSTKRWEALPERMAVALRTHDLIMRACIEEHGGFVFKTIGDAFCAVFADPVEAMQATIDAQRTLAAERWGEVGQVRVRMALHTGTPEHRDRDYFGPPVNRVARLLATGAGGQVLISDAAAAAIGDRLPEGARLIDLGAHRLKDLLQPQRVFQLTAPGLETEFPPIKSLDRQPHNLPAQPTTLVGRDAEVARVRELVEGGDARLVTLTGPGGIGKTRLALQVAADVVDAFPDGAWFAGLAPIADADLVLPTVAQVLGVRESGHEPLESSLIDYLRDKRLLLLLDNLEHVTAAAPLIGRLLAACRGVRVLATSRAVLRIYGEQEFAVPPLPLPDPTRLPALTELAELPSVQLFVERAKAVRPGFELTAEQAAAVAGICVRLDGLPLAIELAAARVRVLLPDKLFERLGKRLDVLTGGASDRDPRQRTLRGAISWSYDLLPPEHRVLFRRLAVFAGGTYDAIEAVCAADGAVDALDGLDALVQQSLLRQEEHAHGAWFFMLESIREFAGEQLEESGEVDGVRDRHAAFHLEMAERAEPELKGANQGEWLDRLELDHDNLRAALSWLASRGRTDDELRFAAALAHFWYTRGYLAEARRWLDHAVDSHPETATPGPTAVKALVAAGIFAETQGELAPAIGRYETALAMARSLGDLEGVTRCLHNLGIAAFAQGHLEEAQARFVESLGINRELDDERGIAQSLEALCRVALLRQEFADAERFGSEALERYRRLGDPWNIANATETLGMLAFLRQDYEGARRQYEAALAAWKELRERGQVAFTLVNLARAERLLDRVDRAAALLEEALDLGRDVGDAYCCGYALHGLGLVAHQRGDHAGARHFLTESLALYRGADANKGVAESLEALAVVACLNGQPADGVVVLGAAEALREAIGVPLPAADRADYDRAVAEARAVMGDAEFRDAWAFGRMLSPEQAAREATALAAVAS